MFVYFLKIYCYDMLYKYRFFQRPTVRQILRFAARTTAERCKKQQRLSLNLTETPGKIHVYRMTNNLCGVAVTNAEYNERVAHTLVSKMLTEFNDTYLKKIKINEIEADNELDNQYMNDLIVKYKNPENQDKLLKIQKNLKEIKDIMHENVEAVLERGENLDKLFQESQDIGNMTKAFGDKARKNNQCCTWY